MKLIISIPVLEGGIKARCHQSLVALYTLLHRANIEFDEQIVENCPYLSVARATLAAMFLKVEDATDQLFVDSDVGFDPEGAMQMLKREEGVVAGIYPLKRLMGGYPVEILTRDGIPLGRDGLVGAKFLPTGFMKLKRGVYSALMNGYPELKFEQSVVEVMGSGITEAYDFFGMGSFGTKFRTEDYAFCQRWRDIGGTCWVYPDINFDHIGSFAFKGNYHEHLLSLPGGAKDPARLEAVNA